MGEHRIDPTPAEGGVDDDTDLCEKSGTLFFTVGEGASTSTSGAFALNLATTLLEKLVDGAECNSWTNLCGYEMDHTALIASIIARFT